MNKLLFFYSHWHPKLFYQINYPIRRQSDIQHNWHNQHNPANDRHPQQHNMLESNRITMNNESIRADTRRQPAKNGGQLNW